MGKVLYVGASNIEAWRLARALWISDMRRLAASSGSRTRTACSIAAPSARCFRCAPISGVGFTAFSPLAGGWLTGKYRAAGAYPDGSRMTLRPEPYRHLERDAVFRGLARDRGASARARRRDGALAIAWVLHHPRVDAAIIGPRNPAHLATALGATSLELSDEDARRLREVFH